MKKITWARVMAYSSAIAIAVACAGAEDETVVVIVGPDGSAGSGGSAGAGGKGGSGGSGGSATGGSSGTATGGSGGSTGGSAGTGGTVDAGPDTSTGGTGGTGGTPDAASDAPDYDASGPCTPNTVQEQSCGACGKRARLCDTNGTWLAWSDCAGEVGECVPGTQTTQACGTKCGTITLFCSSACIYLPGPCENEGICSPGELTVSNASCPSGQVRSSTCTNTCTAGSWGGCSTSYTWKTMAASTLGARREASAAWNGKYVVIAGGYGSSPTYKEDAALYDPATDKWTQLPAWPTGFTGRELPGLGASQDEIVIWGGYGSSPTAKTDGIKYSFATNTWTAISTTGSPGGRYDFAYAWDDLGKQLIVFGGYGTTYEKNIHAYKPATDSWTTLPASIISARRETQFAWDPVRRWLYIWGGYSGSYLADGAIYDADVNMWRVLPPVPSAFAGRRSGGAAVAGDKFIVFGGYGSSPSYKTDGAVYDPVTHSWTLLPAGPLDGRYNMVALSNGSTALFWGGQGTAPSYKDNGALFDPTTMSWKGMGYGALVQSPTGRYSAVGAWTPQGVVIWGGYSGSYLSDGKVYLP